MAKWVDLNVAIALNRDAHELYEQNGVNKLFKKNDHNLVSSILND